MKKQFLVLGFRNAGFFKLHRGVKDFVSDIDGKRKRVETSAYEEPINVHHISNVLHVLFNERPVPSLRKVSFQRVEHYYNMALNSYLRIDSIKYKRGDKEYYIPEKIQTKKSVYNAHSTEEVMYWARLKKAVGEDLYAEFLTIMYSLFGSNIVKNKTLEEVIIDLNLNFKNNKQLLAFYNKLKQDGKTSVFDYLTNKSRTNINAARSVKLTINNGFEEITKLFGRIVISLEEKDIENLQNSSGVATILDGGLVYIVGLIPSNKINLSSFTPVKEISTNTYSVKNENKN